ncbi:hypothetical protein O6H91_03G123700 [Diphasiastrum complanatum]|uniref:Uncharacterized protein n=1 Tax=Diphasiastrum complanatum TaxID=34168 RepID=A0ACC2EAU1_DIPCM|nr:hypothetical protein O6H91_03G123700 [Diphasiastrum complanatum]
MCNKILRVDYQWLCYGLSCAVKFQDRLCLVQHLSVLSTARTCEIYSQNEINGDADYVCTLRGDVPKSGNTFSIVETSSNKLATTVVASSHGHLEINASTSNNFMEEGNELQDGAKSIVPLDKDFYDSRQFVLDDNRNDSLSSSLATMMARKSLPLDDGEAECLSRSTVESTFDEETQNSTGESEKKGIVDHFVKADCSTDAFECSESHSVSQTHLAAIFYYEAKMHANNGVPWAALKVRMLSLSDKSCVKVANITIHAKAGPVFPTILEPSDSFLHSQQRDQSIGPSLLAMLVPGMLKTVQGLPDVRNGRDSQVGTRLQESNFTSGIVQGPSQPSMHTFMSIMGQRNTEGPRELTDVWACSASFSQQGSSLCTKVPRILGSENVAEESSETPEIEDDSIGFTAEAHKQYQNSVLSVNKRPDFEKGLEPKDVQRAVTRHAYDDMMCPGERRKESPTLPSPEINLSKLEAQVEAAMNGFKEELVARLDRLETMCLRIESYLQSAFQSFDNRLQVLEAPSQRMMHSESHCSQLPVCHLNASSDALMRTQKTEAFDKLVGLCSPSLSHMLDVHALNSSVTPHTCLQPICSGSHSSPLTQEYSLPSSTSCSSSNSTSLAEMPSFTCIDPVQLHSSTFGSKLDTSCPNAVASDDLPFDMNARTELSDLEATLSHLSPSIDSSVEIPGHGKTTVSENKEGYNFAPSDSLAIVQPKVLSLDEALLSALSAFSASNLHASVPDSVNGSSEVLAECIESEAFSSKETASCDGDDNGTSYVSFKSANSEVSEDGCQTMEVTDHLSCKGLLKELEDTISKNLVFEEVQASKSEEVSEMQNEAVVAISQSSSSLEMEKVASSENVADFGRDTVLNSSIECVPFVCDPGIGFKTGGKDLISAEICEQDAQCSDTTMLIDKISCVASHSDDMPEDMIDLISWNDQTSADSEGGLLISLKEITMTYLDFGEAINTCDTLNGQTSADSEGGLAISLKEITMTDLDFGEAINMCDNKTCVVSESIRQDVDSTMHIRGASNVLQSEIAASLSDSITGRDAGKDTDSLEVVLSNLKPAPSVNQIDNITGHILDDFFACNTTRSMDIRERAAH